MDLACDIRTNEVRQVLLRVLRRDQALGQVSVSGPIDLSRPEARLRVERNRRIHTYQEHTFTVEALSRTLSNLRAHTDVHPDLIVVDGYDWSAGSEPEIAALKDLARTEEAVLWMAATIDKDAPVSHPAGYPEPVARFEALCDVLLRLKGAGGTVHLSLLKGPGGAETGAVGLDLDPATLLLVRS